MVSMLTPVPTIHLESAIEMIEKFGSVAFGSDAFEIMDRLKDSEVDVWVYASITGSDNIKTNFSKGKVVLRGTIKRGDIVEATKSLSERIEHLRPETTKTDLKFGYYYILSNINIMPRPEEITAFRYKSGTPVGSPPLGPIEIEAPSL